jgi:probable O-glycosylation ligase (exosortase A-associated)
MRDLLVFGYLAFVLITVWKRPFNGVVAWVLFGVMNVHRLTYGAAYSFPFSQIVAIALVVALLLHTGHKEIKGGAPAVVMALFLAWCVVTTLFAFQPEAALDYFVRLAKTFVMTWVILAVMHTRQQVKLLIWTLVLSIGFYGVKGGVFVLATGGAHMVNGPPEGPIEGNNSLAVGLVATIPLMFYLMTQSKQRWLRWGFVGAMALSTVSVLGSFSRGALLAVGAMGAMLWIRGTHKLSVATAAIVFVLVAVPFMPERWSARMNTIQTYEEDNSAMYRLQAWETAYNIAKDRFPIGGGFEWFGPQVSIRYSPNPDLVMSPHSIYFEVLGSQGFGGLAVYLLFWFLVWRQCAWLRAQGKKDPQFEWARALGSMVQVAIVGYMVGGAFLNLAFWEFCFYLYAAVGAARFVVQNEQALVLPATQVSATAVPNGHGTSVPAPLSRSP